MIIVFSLICSCASLGTSNQSVIVITNVDANDRSQLSASIDGKDIGIVKDGETKTFSVTNGRHSIVLKRRTMIMGKWEKWETVETEIFEIYNERYEFEVIGYNRSSWGGRRISQPKITPLTQLDPSQMIVARDNAIANSFDSLQQLIPDGSKIAIISISPNNSESIFILDELMVKFVNSRKYIVVDRQTLETIRQEQRFQMTGEVSDESAVSIGGFIGADVVITGTITGTGDQRRLRLRALSVLTAQVLAMSSEPI